MLTPQGVPSKRKQNPGYRLSSPISFLDHFHGLHYSICYGPPSIILWVVPPKPIKPHLICIKHFCPVGCQPTLSTCTMPHEPQYLGLGLPNPFWEQGISAVCLFLEHANSHTMESTLIQTSMEYLHLKLGTSRNIFDLPYTDWEFLATDCWLKSLWQFIDFAKISLISNMPPMPPARWQGDRFFMDQVMSMGLLPKTTSVMNWCPVALTSISGLTWSMDGVTRFLLPFPNTPCQLGTAGGNGW